MLRLLSALPQCAAPAAKDPGTQEQGYAPDNMILRRQMWQVAELDSALRHVRMHIASYRWAQAWHQILYMYRCQHSRLLKPVCSTLKVQMLLN